MIVTYTIDSQKDGDGCLLAHHQADDMLLVLRHFDNDLRNEVKYGEGDPAAWAEKWREALHAKLAEFGVDICQ